MVLKKFCLVGVFGFTALNYAWADPLVCLNRLIDLSTRFGMFNMVPPLRYLESLTPQILNETQESVQFELKDMGVAYEILSPFDASTRIDDFFLEIRTQQSAKLWRQMRLLRIKSLPKKTGAASASEFTLLHPDLPVYLEKMKKMGYFLAVDPSLDLKTGAAAYFTPSDRVIAIEPTTPWIYFIHEYEHLLFNETIAQKIESSPIYKKIEIELETRHLRSKLSNNKQNLAEIDSIFDKFHDDAYHAFLDTFADNNEDSNPTLQRVLNAYAKGVRGALALNETASTTKTIGALRLEGYTLWDYMMLSDRAYRNYHQLLGLRAIPTRERSPQQIQLIKKLLLEQTLLSVVSFARKQAVRNTIIVGGSLTIGAGLGILFISKEDKWWLIKDNKAHAVNTERLEKLFDDAN